MKETNVMCPVCGAKFAISENEHVVSNAVVIGKDSNLGNVFLRLEDDRKAQLERRGIDTSKYFSISSPKGDDVLMRWGDNGQPEMVDENDPVIVAIRKAGSVPNRRLFRRWVMAQMFRGLSFEGWRGDHGFHSWMKWYGYHYTWKMAVEEYRVQAVLYRKDEENFRMRNRWFDKGVALAMCEDYIAQLRDYVKRVRVRHCKRVPYKRIGGKNIFVADLYNKVFNPLEIAKRKVAQSATPRDLYDALCDFVRTMPLNGSHFKQCYEWQDAYKGSGAYFTMRNLIMFHGANYVGCNGYDESLRKLDEYARDCYGYEMLGALKEMIRQNGIDIRAKMAEWRKK